MISERFSIIERIGRNENRIQSPDITSTAIMIDIFTKNIARITWRTNFHSGVVLCRKEKLKIPEKNASRALIKRTCSMESSGTQIFCKESIIDGA